MNNAIKNIREMAAGYAARGMAQPSLLRDLIAAADEVEALRAERDALREALEAIRDYCENPAAVGAQDMTPAQKVGGMWSQAVAALAPRAAGAGEGEG